MLLDNGRRVGLVRVFLVIYLMVMTTLLFVPGDWLPDWLRGGESMFPGFGAKDKLLHAGSFAILAVLGIRATTGAHFWPRALLILVICVFYGLVTEILQGMSGLRDYDLFDLVADIVGTFLGIGFAWMTDRRQKDPTPSLFPQT